MGTSRTQVVKFIRKGDKGDKGEQGATLRGPQAWSDCATGYAFQAGNTGEEWKDVVLYNGSYYSCVKSHTKTASNYPGSTTAVNNGYWQLGDKIELVATKILLATYALVKNLGVTAIDMKDANGNILFQAKDGNVTCKTGTFDGIKVRNATIESGKIAGLKISGDSLTNEGFDNDAYIILRNDLHKVFAGIGGNMLPISSGLRAVARFENEESNGFWGGTNIAMIVRASGAEKNRAIIATGDILTKGLNIGYSFHEYSFTADNQWQKPSILKSDILYVYFNHSNCVFVLPTLREVCDSLDINYSTQFAFRLTIISSAGSGKLCGRNDVVPGTSGNEYPQLRKPDGGIDSSGYNISGNDSFEVCLFYQGGNSYIPTSGDAYRAYLTNISR